MPGVTAELPPGFQLGRYAIEAPISQGAMGAVYRATNRVTGQPVAVKRLLDTRHAARFEIEARLLSQLKHPRVVEVLDHFQDQEGVYYLVMELVEGMDLGMLVEKAGIDTCRETSTRLHELALELHRVLEHLRLHVPVLRRVDLRAHPEIGLAHLGAHCLERALILRRAIREERLEHGERGRHPHVLRHHGGDRRFSCVARHVRDAHARDAVGGACVRLLLGIEVRGRQQAVLEVVDT
jgi:hypothetical protein